MARGRLIRKPPIKGHARIISTDDTEKKKIKQQIAKKRYEIDMLQIELDHPKKLAENKLTIGFSLHPEKYVN